jgi:hypothetical protein
VTFAGGWPSARRVRALLSARPSSVSEREFELLDLAIELLRGMAEARTPELRELCPRVLDLQRLGVEFGIAYRDHPIALGERPPSRR